MVVNTFPLEEEKDPYELIKLQADLIDKNYFSMSCSNGAPQFTSKDMLLFYLQYYIRYSKSLEERIRDLEDKLN